MKLSHYHIIFIFCSLFFAQKMQAQAPFGDSTVISVLTCSPGEAVYARFGHTGLRFRDPQSATDVVFNYGLFSFESDNFILKFVKGETYYQLGAENTASFLYQYEKRNSNVTEQILNLTPTERQRIIDLVLENYEPQNRTYLYNFVFDNCATRPFYKISEGIDGKMAIDTLAEQKTFRKWIEAYAGADKWLMFGIDLLFGADADKICTPAQSLFLPEVLMSQLNKTKIIDNTGEKDIVSSESVLVKAGVKAKKKIEFFNPHFVNILILIVLVILTIFLLKIKKGIRWLVFALLFVSGLFGLIIAYLMFASLHPLVHHNWNILWLNPLNLIAAFLLFFKKKEKIMRFYIRISVLMLVALAMAAIWNVQVFNSAVYPLWILFGFVYFYFLKFRQK